MERPKVKLLLELEVEGYTKQEIEDEFQKAKKGEHSDLFPIPNEPDIISLDNAYLSYDPDDDSFYIFKYLGVKE